MQGNQLRSPGNFNSPLQNIRNLPPYQRDDLNNSEQVIDSPMIAGTNGPSALMNRSDMPLNHNPSIVDASVNIPNLPGDEENSNNGHVSLDVPANHNIQFVVETTAPESELLQTTIKRTIIEIVKTNLLNMILFILITVTVKCNVSYLSILVFLWLCNTYNIISVSQSTSNRTVDKWKNIFIVIVNLLSAVFKVFLVIRIETKALIISAPLGIVLAFDMCVPLTKWFFHRKTSVRIVYKIETIIKLFFVVQAIIIALKADDILHWRWREVFWVYWIGLAVMIGMTFAFLLIFMNKCCAYMFAEMELSETRGVFWVFLNLGGITSLSCALVIEVIGVLQNGDNQTGLLGVLIAIPVYNFVLAVYTAVCYKEIEALFKKLVAMDLVLAREQPVQEGGESAPSAREPEKIDIPKFLMKLSNTYFRRATQEEIQQMKERNAKKAAAAKNARMEKPAKRRQNSLDYSKMKNTGNENTTHLNLLTVHETEADRTKTTIVDNWNNTSRFGMRTDKGKDFLSGMTDRTGVSGIIPSGLISSKTDRMNHDTNENKDYSTLTSNDSYLLPPVSKDTEAPLKPAKKDRKDDKNSKNGAHDLSQLNTPDVSPVIPTEAYDDSTEVKEIKVHRRVQSMQDISPVQIMSLREAIESPKMKGSIVIPEAMMSPKSDASGGVQCLICFDNQPDAVFMECGHGGICYECSLEIWKSTNECYLCRNKITQVLQIDIKTQLGNQIVKVLSSTQMVLYDEDEDPEGQAANQEYGEEGENEGAGDIIEDDSNVEPQM